MPENDRIIVVGAGAAGLMAAGRAGESGAHVLLLERMEEPGKKVLISGKERCNLTNAQDLEDFIRNYGPNGRFLYGPFSRFFREDLLGLLGRHGVETTLERGGRIFPSSGNARDVVKALRQYATGHGTQIENGTRAQRILVRDGRVAGVRTDQGARPGRAVVLATGGASYPATGSTGDGFRMAEALGHTIVKLRPALVPLAVEEVTLAKSMQGGSLKNVRLTSYQCRANEIDRMPEAIRDFGRRLGEARPPRGVIESRLGEMMLTHFGVGGPITLQMSLAIVDALKKGPVSIAIDLKPGLTMKLLQLRLQRDFETYGKRSFRHILAGLLPRKLIDPFVELCGIEGEKTGHEITGTERDRLAALLKSLRFNIANPLPLSVAMVTAGGVSLKEIDPRTMASRIVGGLYLCGEVIDIDGDTGGYNLQAAFSTGYVAGESAARYVKVPSSCPHT